MKHSWEVVLKAEDGDQTLPCVLAGLIVKDGITFAGVVVRGYDHIEFVPVNALRHTQSKPRGTPEIRMGVQFEEIWQKYPKRVGKMEAKASFARTVQDDNDFEQILLALSNYLSSSRVKAGFVLDGSRWFKRWQDWTDFKDLSTKAGDETKEERVARLASSIQGSIDDNF
jgi:hypothetical protein